jgi:DNA replication protein DnaC
MTLLDQIKEKLIQLRLKIMAQRLEEVIQQARLNEKITLDAFDFPHHKSRQDQKAQILDLLNLDFVSKRRDVILIGNPGTGKTFLAKCIAYAACNANIKVLLPVPWT